MIIVTVHGDSLDMEKEEIEKVSDYINATAIKKDEKLRSLIKKFLLSVENTKTHN